MDKNGQFVNVRNQVPGNPHTLVAWLTGFNCIMRKDGASPLHIIFFLSCCSDDVVRADRGRRHGSTHAQKQKQRIVWDVRDTSLPISRTNI